MRILITGASGQIGSNLGLHCLDAGHTVYGLDCRPNTWTTRFPVLLHDLVQPLIAAPAERALISWGTPDVVVHLAGYAKVHRLVVEPQKALANIAMIQNALEFCRVLGVPMIFASSREVYGNTARESTAEEDADFRLAASPYAASKLAGETLVYSYSRCYGLPYLVVRLSNVYGRYDNDLQRMERVIPLFVEKINRGEPLILFGGDRVFDFTHIDDCVAGISNGIRLLVEGRVANQTINLARGEGHSLRQLCNFLMKSTGISTSIIDAPAQIGEINRYVANLDKARELLGYEPSRSLPNGIDLMLADIRIVQHKVASSTEEPRAGRDYAR